MNCKTYVARLNEENARKLDRDAFLEALPQFLERLKGAIEVDRHDYNRCMSRRFILEFVSPEATPNGVVEVSGCRSRSEVSQVLIRISGDPNKCELVVEAGDDLSCVRRFPLTIYRKYYGDVPRLVYEGASSGYDVQNLFGEILELCFFYQEE